MSYNGSGTFNINTAGQPVVTGTVISSTAFNALTADLGTGLSTAITKDGQTVATARIPFASGISGPSVTNATGVAIQGTATNDSATAGYVGEFVSSSPNSYTVTASASNMTTISLTAGDWDVSAQAGSAGLFVGTLSMRLCISSASAAFTAFNSGGFGQGDQAFAVDAATGVGSAAIPPIRLSLASTTTVYLVIVRYGGSNFSANGIISARRVR